jgi:hypothetical protein
VHTSRARVLGQVGVERRDRDDHAALPIEGTREHGAAIAGARDDLVVRAAKISDPEWRRRFLTVPPW